MHACHPGEQQSGDPNVITHGPISIDLTGFSVSVNGLGVRLTLTEFLILVELARHPGRFRDRHALTTALQEHGPPFDASPLSAPALNTHIARLRAKLHKAGCDCIETMKYVGYRFVAD